jgi:peptide/nickel transport system permease protein
MAAGVPGQIFRRVLFALATLFVISMVTFLATNVLPGDPARKALGLFSSPQRRAQYDRQQGLNKPVLVRYGYWIGNLAKGDWGKSLVNGYNIQSTVFSRARRTLVIAVLGFLIALPFAVVLGIFAATRSGTAGDVSLSVASLVMAALPEFLVATILILIFAVWLGVLPVDSSAVSFGTGSQQLKAYVLPSLSLAVISFPYLFRMVRANVRESWGAGYTRAAMLRGIRGRRLLIHHVGPNSGVALVTVAALSLAELIGGIVIVENVFAFPGIGQLLVDAIQTGDVAVVQAIVVIIAVGFVGLNLLADLIAFGLDPRLRRPRVA